MLSGEDGEPGTEKSDKDLNALNTRL